MTFLKKIGSVLATFGKVLLPVGPELMPLLLPSPVGSEIGNLLNVVVQMEAIGQGAGLTGAQKLAAAAPLIGTAFMNTTLLAGKKPADPTAAATAINGITSALADLLNAYGEDAVSSTTVAPAPAAVAPKG